MSLLVCRLRKIGVAAAAFVLATTFFVSLVSPLAAQQPKKASPAPEIRVKSKLPGGATIEEQVTRNPNFNITAGLRGPDGQMLIDFGTYGTIWSQVNYGHKVLEVRRQSSGILPAQELRGLYDLEQRRFILPCEYSDYRPWGEAFIVFRRVQLKPKTPETSYVGLYDPAAGRETFTSEGIRILEHEKKTLVLMSHKETAVFDAKGREAEPRRYNTVAYDAKLPAWRVQLSRAAGSPWGYISAATGKALTPVHYTKADDFAGGVARVQRDGRYTFIDATGREPRPEGYGFLTPFRGGVAAFARSATVPASYLERVRGTGWGFVTATGEESATAYEDVGYDASGPILQEDRVLVKHGGRWLAVDPRLPAAEAVAAAVPARWEPFQDAGQNHNRPWGFRIPGGETMLAPKWAVAQPFIGPYAPFGVAQSRTFANGNKTSKSTVTAFGLIDATGREVLSPRFAQIKRLDDNLAVVADFDVTGRSLFGVLDLRTLQVVVPPRYSWELMYAGEGSTALRAGHGNTWRLIDTTGRELTAVYDSMSTFKEGMLKVQKGSSWYWLDRDLKPVHADKRYVKIEEFHQGRARVWTGSPDQYGRYRGEAVIDHTGKVLQTIADATGAPQYSAPRVVQCGVCNGTGKKFREVKVEYSGSGGSALIPYTPAGSSTAYTSGSYTKSEYVGICTACDGRGTAQPFKKK